MNRYIILMLIIFTCLSCGKKSPVEPGTQEPNHNCMLFGNPVDVFPGGGDGIFYDADISEIIRGPGYGEGIWGTLWPDWHAENHWAVAVALREVGPPTNGNRRICYRFLGQG